MEASSAPMLCLDLCLHAASAEWRWKVLATWVIMSEWKALKSCVCVALVCACRQGH